jgi:hypothetical protein
MLRNGLIVTACLLAVTDSAGAASDGPVELREFDVRVDDHPVGVHHLRIRQQDGRTLVAMKSDVAVQVLLYRYSHVSDAQEVWSGASLLAVDAHTNANGKKSRLRLKRNADRALIQFQDRISKTEPPHQTTAYSRLPPGIQHEQTVRLLNLDDGELVKTTWHSVEDAKFRVADDMIECRKWVVKGGREAELWFDAAGWLVRQKTMEQGHPTELRLTSIQRERTVP